ncbi:MAG: hypothetical protein ABI231_06310 [Candidatus Tumulicola sp.]
MTARVVAIGLKIPDNEAYTAAAALRRMGLDVDAVERSEIWSLDDAGDAATFPGRVRANEAIFNPNKHRLTVLDLPAPRSGEAWIAKAGARDEVREHLGGKGIAGVARARRYVGWRLLGRSGSPVARETLVAAVERLLCNPAIEKATY